MHIILGASGHVGSALADSLLKQGEAITVVIHDPKNTRAWQDKGAEVAVADVNNTDALHKIFRQGKRLFLLNPPADPATDTVTEEHKTLDAILKALDGSGIEKVVAESTYGAQPGEGIGDLGVLYDMEQALKAKAIPAIIIRAAYYMSNWDSSLQTARKEGIVHTLYPIHFKLPMVAPWDIGQMAADFITRPLEMTGLHYVEGPEMYAAADVAAAFAEALHQPVKALETPSDQWAEALASMGFSAKAAAAMAAMTRLTLEQQDKKPTAPDRGATTLQEYIQLLVRKDKDKPR